MFHGMIWSAQDNHCPTNASHIWSHEGPQRTLKEEALPGMELAFSVNTAGSVASHCDPEPLEKEGCSYDTPPAVAVSSWGNPTLFTYSHPSSHPESPKLCHAVGCALKGEGQA